MRAYDIIEKEERYTETKQSPGSPCWTHRLPSVGTRPGFRFGTGVEELYEKKVKVLWRITNKTVGIHLLSYWFLER
jgi:hypothetical protein